MARRARGVIVVVALVTSGWMLDAPAGDEGRGPNVKRDAKPSAQEGDVGFTPAWTGWFRVEVINTGEVGNCYTLRTN